MIKAIERCSLQATFDLEMSSTKELLSKESEDSSFITYKANRDSDINPVDQRWDFDETAFFSAEPRIDTSIWPVDLINKDNNVPSDLTTNYGSIPLISTHQNNNTSCNGITNYSDMPTISTSVYGNMPAVVVGEDGTVPYQQSNFLGQVPLKSWGQKVSYCASLFYPSALLILSSIIRLKSFANGPTQRESIAIFMTCLTPITSTQITTVSGMQRTFSASAVPRIPSRYANAVEITAVSGPYARGELTHLNLGSCRRSESRQLSG